ncbi:MAG: RagB/SusD family nutrient uptake outer membrane protein [Prevotella sp.]|nr:RagB/SusD family nutrient uptake outer membrane protein [Prevotella sp.]
MKKITLAALIIGALTLPTSCIEEYEPQNGNVTGGQAGAAPGSFDNFVSGITTSLNGQSNYSNDPAGNANDFGMPSMFIMHDVMGQDMVSNGTNTDWFSSWYMYDQTLGPSYANCQMPWTVYYAWIKNCNTVISMAGAEPSEERKAGAGIAYAVRAAMYEDLARLYASKTYAQDPQAETVPYIDENTTAAASTNNPRKTNEEMWALILADLDKAEEYLQGYQRTDGATPNLSVVYGLKARAYLTMEDWPNAEKYAKLAMEDYNVMSADEYTDPETGFNSPNGAWMWYLTYKADDQVLSINDADTSWGSWMTLEITNGYGYASNYGAAHLMDRHLYETIPATDCRKKCFLDFSLDEMTSESEQLAKLSEYTDYPEQMVITAEASGLGFGGLSVKFRAAGGEAGHANQYTAFLQSVPLMRVEEMKLIEAEAVGMQAGREAEGIALLTAFAQQRDPNYVYGQHNESYGNTSTSAFQNEIWWQRRVEFWGEGLSLWDIKRLNKAVIRSYAGTNHLEGMRWNSTDAADRAEGNNYPSAMNFCIVQSETNYNTACTNNPAPQQPAQDSPEYTW